MQFQQGSIKVVKINWTWIATSQGCKQETKPDCWPLTMLAC